MGKDDDRAAKDVGDRIKRQLSVETKLPPQMEELLRKLQERDRDRSPSPRK